MPQTTGAVHDQILEIIKPKGWAVLPQRWVVERTLCWLNNSRRLPKDYEISTTSEENMIMISHLHTLLRRFLNTGSYSGELLEEHSLAVGVGKCVRNSRTSHPQRDSKTQYRELIDKVLEGFGRDEQAELFIGSIMALKPRYTRDQMGIPIY